MALGHFGPQGVRFVSGAPARGRPIRVETEAGALISLFHDPSGLEPAPNPKLTDENGNLFFYSSPGEYFLEFDTARIPILVEEIGAGGGGAESFTHTQLTPAATWIVTHNLGTFREPLVFLASDPDTPVFTDIDYPDDNHTTIVFDQPVAGRAEF